VPVFLVLTAFLFSPLSHFSCSGQVTAVNLSLHKPVTDKKDPKDQFFYPRARYHGDFKPENLAFNANLQEFAQRVAYICGLETGGKLSSEEAYDEIRRLWKQLKRSKNELLDTPKPPPPELPSDDEPPTGA
jgi:hypothetical protein